MENHKLRVRVGVHEFEAEGTEEAVAAQFAVWKELINGSSAKPLQPSPPAARGTEPRAREGYIHIPGVFMTDDKRKLVTLEVHPPGESREADALLLLLYGYSTVYSLDLVPVTKLLEAMAVSGLRVDRVDRALAPHTRAGYVLKAGRGKGGKYRLSNTGHARAEEMAKELSGKLV
ncbi:MAG TPA: hypothetical protein VJY35_16655 [Candidatus Eisenbacteria bacterium]|nr:hypothetical protein [Candidatus Eisenbacteria bacterium]